MSFSRNALSISGFIELSFEILRDEFPTAYHLLCSQLAPRTVQMFINDEVVILAFDAGFAHLRQDVRTPTLELHTTRQTILDVIDAHLAPHEAILADAILLRGAIEDLAAFYDGLLTYVHGAVRCPSFPALLDRFRYTSSNTTFSQ